MSQPLPVSNFRWVEDCDRLAASIGDHPTDSPEGYILEVDLGYLEELHVAHNAYPLAPERMVVKKSGCQSTSTTSLALGWRLPKLRSWFLTSATRNATCSTTVTCNFTCRWACVSRRFTGPSASVKAPGWSPTPG